MKNILIVDDEANLRMLYEQELLDEGYRTILAENGRECLEKLETEDVDLVILDVRMPVMDGLEAIGGIIEISKNTSLIINTGFSNYRNDLMSRVADAYLLKSSDLCSLKNTISDVLKKRELLES